MHLENIQAIHQAYNCLNLDDSKHTRTIERKRTNNKVALKLIFLVRDYQLFIFASACFIHSITDVVS